jgi:hypothetical protein
MSIYWFCVGVMGVWLAFEDGPGQLVAKLRDAIEKTFLRGLISCFYCVSLWVAIPVAILISPQWRERLLLWPALSGAAILLERLTSQQTVDPAAPPIFFEDEEENEHVLR